MIVLGKDKRKFFVHVVFEGDRYGLNNCLVHDKSTAGRWGSVEPMIEFYDYTYASKPEMGPRGQFVSRYYASTLAAHKGGGIDLQGGVPEWKIDDAREFQAVVRTAVALIECWHVAHPEPKAESK